MSIQTPSGSPPSIPPPAPKFCPFLSLPKLFVREQSGAVDVDVVTCKGPRCALFVETEPPQEGRLPVGACCFAVTPNVIATLNSVAIQGLQALVAKRKE